MNCKRNYFVKTIISHWHLLNVTNFFLSYWPQDLVWVSKINFNNKFSIYISLKIAKNSKSITTNNYVLLYFMNSIIFLWYYFFDKVITIIINLSYFRLNFWQNFLSHNQWLLSLLLKDILNNIICGCHVWSALCFDWFNNLCQEQTLWSTG